MLIISALLILKILLSFYLPLLQHHPVDTPPLLSLTTLKTHYNADFFYALHALELEHLGDMNGEQRPLEHYNPATLTQWFQSIDALSFKPDLLPFLATFYYGNSPPLKDTCINFLEHHTDHNPQTKWRWLAHAFYLETDSPKALRLSKKLAAYGHLYNLPLWIKESDARYLTHQGHHNEARALFQALLNNPNSPLSTEEINFLKSLLH